MMFSAAVSRRNTRGFLRQVAQPQSRPLVDAERGEVLIIEPDGAGIRAHQPHDHVEGRGLARAVGT